MSAVLLVLAGCGGSAKTTQTTPTPIFNPGSGVYTAAPSVTVSDSLQSAVIYCTTDGSTPTTSSPKCPNPIVMSHSGTISALAAASGYAPSAVATATYTVNTAPQAATPVISPAGGAVPAGQKVTIADASSGTTIYYTTDGSTPSATNGTQYSSPITVSVAETLQAIAVGSSFTPSNVASASYTILPVSTISSLSPSSTAAGGAAFTITVIGTNFDSSAKVQWGSTALATTFVSATQLTAAVPASLIATAGSVSVTVADAGGTSSALTFTINPAVPVISSLSPASATVGGAAFTLTVNGTNFISGATVKWSGSVLTTTFVSSTQLTAAVPASLLLTPGTANITVTDAGGTSSAAAFAVNVGVPVVSSLSPASATAGGAAFTLTVNGTNFISGAIINWGSTPLTTTFVSATQLTATVPASLIATAGTATVTVSDSGGVSNGSAFTINSGAPAISSLSPASATAGDSAFTLTVNGTSFISGATVQWNGTALTTTFVSSTQLTASVPASLIATSGTAGVTVTDASGTSPVAAFIVSAPSGPTIASLSPTSATAGGSDFTLTVNGTNFLSGSTVSWNGTALTTTVVSATQLTAAVPAALLATAGTATVTVTDSVGTSAPATFTINAPAGPSISGTVLSGTTPIAANVQLYSAGSTGYGQGATAIGSPVSTNPATGAFTLTYNCSSLPALGDQLYLVATGSSNSDIALMTGLGSCGSLNSTSTIVVINEATTVASVWALQQFIGAGIAPGGIAVGSSSTNYDGSPQGGVATQTGLKNAFLTIQNLVNLTNGQVLSITPAYANGTTYNGTNYPVAQYLNISTVPQTRINTLANILASCVQQSSNCATLYRNATPPSGTAPANTLEAAFDMAQNPGNNVTALYQLQGANAAPAPYSPQLDVTTPPVDMTIALSFSGGGFGGYPYDYFNVPQQAFTPNGMAIDAGGNIFVSGNLASKTIIAKFSNLGAALTPPTTYTAGPKGPNAGNAIYTYGGVDTQYGFGSTRVLAGYAGGLLGVDLNGYVWFGGYVGGNVDIAAANPDLSTPLVYNLSGIGTMGNLQSIAFDSFNDMWFGGSNVGEADGTGTYIGGGSKDTTWTPSTTGGTPILNLAFDSNSKLWGSASGKYVYQLPASGHTAPASYSDTNLGAVGPLAADSQGNVYAGDTGAGTGVAGFSVYNSGYSTSSAVTSYSSPLNSVGFSASYSLLAIDGLGHLWAPAFEPISDFSAISFTSNLWEFNYNGNSSNKGAITMLSPANGLTGTSTSEANLLDGGYGVVAEAIDSSGNLWLLNGSSGEYDSSGTFCIPASLCPASNVLVQFVGMAGPVATPAAQAVANNGSGTGVGQRP